MSSSRGPPSPPSHPNPIDPFAAAAAAEAEGEAAPPPRNPIIPREPPSPEMEATAEALTREEVLRRRRRRAKRLVDVYRRLYWTLGEELRARHRQYVWELGRSPLEAEQPPPPPLTSAAPGPGGDLVVVRPVSATVPRRKKCGFAGCKVRTMAMARFCHSHILSDPNQVLYKGCAYISKRQVAENPLLFSSIQR
uniref:KANL2-like probable zinc-finger domain-containing protein n=1 Tax=Oryza meridionalis TaxID=40149 RepID=A0A0E0DPM6_9ORYZ